MSFETFSLSLPRNAFSIRDAARAGDVWRAFQDAAVQGSTARGWPPARYAAEKCAFVVRRMTVVHHRETCFGEAVAGSTWVERFRRGIFSTRQIRLEVEGRPLASATQEWVHVVTDGEMQVARASESLLSSFEEHAAEPLVTLPEFDPCEGREHQFEFTVWFTSMDPLNHANHPAYVDWSDEALCQIMHRAGLDPTELVPVAEDVRFKNGVVAPERVRVTLRMVGRTEDGAVVVKTRVHRPSGTAAEATLVRSMVGGPEPLALALGGI